MRRSTAPTLADVAQEAGVTTMVASVVLNGARSSTRVSAATRARVQEAAARLRYRRNALALGLTRSRIDTLGVVATVVGEDINLYFLELFNGILSGAAERGQTTKVLAISNWETEASRIPGYCDGRVDGIILIAPMMPEEVRRALPRHTPFVTIHADQPLPGTPSLDIDNEEAACAAVRYLISQGHRRILHFTGDLEIQGARQRIAGYRRALEEAGIPADPSLVVRGRYNIDSGRESMIRILDERPTGDLPTALFASSDAIAYGAMDVLQQRGIRVPEEISVMGFDDVLLARTTRPPLTTMRQPFRQIGRRAVELLLAQIAGMEEMPEEPNLAAMPTRESTTELLEVELVERDSVGPPRKMDDD